MVDPKDLKLGTIVYVDHVGELKVIGAGPWFNSYRLELVKRSGAPFNVVTKSNIGECFIVLLGSIKRIVQSTDSEGNYELFERG